CSQWCRETNIARRINPQCPARLLLERATFTFDVAKQLFDCLIYVIGLGGRARQPRDERVGVVDVVGVGNEVWVRPECVARFGADSIRDALPQRGGLAQSARAKLELNECGERGLAGTARRSA